ncbi:glycosyltransferase 87 family protein [Dactylosporangium fulvum]|uniref:Glycosyltransferase 87 family protein n=1 Tax=Dactylosporangium fulvum TaxID=53359 RepID=A0ABY5W028_9ACTN|nr:glycosyltransferase 87 family protein [Dactylosporangium fulvum]UWP82716.1 glycosyltransferase 87 family protein [Dactylosporangium fulvum]
MVDITIDRRTRLLDAGFYALCAAFAGVTALTSTLMPHRAWGAIAWFGYAAAALLALTGLIRRTWLVSFVYVAVALVPLVTQAVQRAGGRTDRAQEEVLVVEQAGERLLATGTPYLNRPSIAALPTGEQLLGYTPYQPGMALFGLPRATLGSAWWTDARIWFAVVTTGLIWYALSLLRPRSTVLVAQAVLALPLCTLTLATGGDDLPVLALALLAIAFAARSRFLAAGVAVGLAGALKLFALPVAVVLLLLAWRTGRLPAARRFASGAFGLPLLALLPPLLAGFDAYVENVLRFPSGHGLVTSPAQSPLPGHLIAEALPAGKYISLGLLLLAALALGWWLLRRPPAGAGAAALVVAVGLTCAIMLTPTTRFGYLLYPAAFLALWGSLRTRAADTDADTEDRTRDRMTRTAPTA